VREQRSKLSMTTPVEQITSRGRAVRARRRITAASGLLAVLAAAAVAVTALLPASHHLNRGPAARLTAWTVTQQANGTLDVTVRQWRDPAGLQATLRADGLPVTVTPPPNLSCRPYRASPGLLNAIARFRTPALRPGSRTVLVIHPPALPSGAGLSISIAPAMQPPPASKRAARAVPPVPIGLVDASQQCTGS
jgi:hypothetical protein